MLNKAEKKPVDSTQKLDGTGDSLKVETYFGSLGIGGVMVRVKMAISFLLREKCGMGLVWTKHKISSPYKLWD